MTRTVRPPGSRLLAYRLRVLGSETSPKLDARRDAELDVGPLLMALDGPHADDEAVGDLTVGETLRGEQDDLGLPTSRMESVLAPRRTTKAAARGNDSAVPRRETRAMQQTRRSPLSLNAVAAARAASTASGTSPIASNSSHAPTRRVASLLLSPTACARTAPATAPSIRSAQRTSPPQDVTASTRTDAVVKYAHLEHDEAVVGEDVARLDGERIRTADLAVRRRDERRHAVRESRTASDRRARCRKCGRGAPRLLRRHRRSRPPRRSAVWRALRTARRSAARTVPRAPPRTCAHQRPEP